jgi:phosphoglycolate phosphatase-like HAD superfamily hydrolase
MRTYILDIDGTLLPTHEVDNHCYWQAVSSVFERRLETQALAAYTHITDGGILQEWCQRELGRPPDEAEILAVQEQFLALTEQAAGSRPEDFLPIAGVESWLESQASSGAGLAIATGGWALTARFKLRISGLDRLNMPLASGDDSISRTEIMQTALQRLAHPSQDLSLQPTYVGDGIWDFLSAQSLGWQFLGIASGDRAQALRQVGAEWVYGDFEALMGDHSIA